MKEKYPFILERIQSILIDSVIIMACMILFSDILSNFKNVPNWVRAFLFVSLFLYEPVMTTFSGTIGNNIKGIRVRKHSDENTSITFFQAVIRYAFKLLLGWLSFISIFSNNKKRAIHDIVSGTVMIKINNSNP
jgi:uncharacterized RDD family membrane protein YckC